MLSCSPYLSSPIPQPACGTVAVRPPAARTTHRWPNGDREQLQEKHIKPITCSPCTRTCSSSGTIAAALSTASRLCTSKSLVAPPCVEVLLTPALPNETQIPDLESPESPFIAASLLLQHRRLACLSGDKLLPSGVWGVVSPPAPSGPPFFGAFGGGSGQLG